MTNTRDYSQINLRRAFSDFDGDVSSIIEVLQEFLEDTERRTFQLDELPAAANQSYIGVVHEIANSLGTAWCFHAGQGVRSIEDELRSSSHWTDTQSATTRIKLWVNSARTEVIDVLARTSKGFDLFDIYRD